MDFPCKMIAEENVHVAARRLDTVGGVRRELVACKGLDALHGGTPEAAEGQGGVSGTSNCNLNPVFFSHFLLKMQKEWGIAPEK